MASLKIEEEGHCLLSLPSTVRRQELTLGVVGMGHFVQMALDIHERPMRQQKRGRNAPRHPKLGRELGARPTGTNKGEKLETGPPD